MGRALGVFLLPVLFMYSSRFNAGPQAPQKILLMERISEPGACEYLSNGAGPWWLFACFVCVFKQVYCGAAGPAKNPSHGKDFRARSLRIPEQWGGPLVAFCLYCVCIQAGLLRGRRPRKKSFSWEGFQSQEPANT